jgi:hypothetical protein
VNAHSAVATWEAPIKNPEYVELYRILWRKEGARYPTSKVFLFWDAVIMQRNCHFNLVYKC